VVQAHVVADLMRDNRVQQGENAHLGREGVLPAGKTARHPGDTRSSIFIVCFPEHVHEEVRVVLSQEGGGGRRGGDRVQAG